ncbi:hypothetical protein RvY_06976-1 [Ramazzottius varieornatus]|uniref:Uncharacterized protein n=1 Tax=Ramazzottius varieornatus TaxID=947166 RepID=A0A1D1V5P5_RAMVA|nr:hypothetical protein RvY_06976-1 [Ramazzottius varieornatus]
MCVDGCLSSICGVCESVRILARHSLQTARYCSSTVVLIFCSRFDSFEFQILGLSTPPGSFRKYCALTSELRVYVRFLTTKEFRTDERLFKARLIFSNINHGRSAERRSIDVV